MTRKHTPSCKPYSQWTAEDWDECEGDREHPDYAQSVQPVVARASQSSVAAQSIPPTQPVVPPKRTIHNWLALYGKPDGKCHFEGCTAKAYGNKLPFCYQHYYQVRGVKRVRPIKCYVRGCDQPREDGHHWCAEHWAQRALKRKGAAVGYFEHPAH